MANVPPELRKKYWNQLQKAISYLDRSFGRASRLPLKLSQNDDSQLEIWESFAARFARVVDLYLTKVLRAEILLQDAGFDGTLKDLLLAAEKANLIKSAEQWMQMRALRNIQAHDYTDESFSKFVGELIHFAPVLISLKEK